MKEEGNSTSVASTIPSVLIACALISYVIGLLNGFIRWLGTFAFLLPLSGGSFTLLVSPIWFFAVYPLFSITFLERFIIIPSFGISPLSLCFLLLAGLSLTFVCLRRLLWGFLFAFSAVALGIIQFTFISMITGFTPLGTNLTASVATPTLYVIFFIHRNVVPLLISESFLAVGIAVCLHRIYIGNKRLLGGFEAPSLEHFRILKSINWELALYAIPFLISLVLIWNYWLLARVEFPNYYLFVDLLNIYRIGLSLPVLNWTYLFVLFAILKIFRNITIFLAEKYTPLFERKVENSVQPVDKIKRSLGLEKVDNRTFKAFINNVASVSKRRNGIIGTYRDFIYDKKFLVQIAEKEIEKQGQTDINKIASELLVPPEFLTVIYSLLIMADAIKGVKVTRENLIIKTPEPRY